MADGDLKAVLERFDAHLARFDAHFSRSDDVTERNTRAFERNTHAFERNTQAYERNARAWGKTISAPDAIRESIEDMSDEIRANTRAILHVIDRLENGGRRDRLGALALRGGERRRERPRTDPEALRVRRPPRGRHRDPEQVGLVGRPRCARA